MCAFKNSCSFLVKGRRLIFEVSDVSDFGGNAEDTYARLIIARLIKPNHPQLHSKTKMFIRQCFHSVCQSSVVQYVFLMFIYSTYPSISLCSLVINL